MVELREMFIVMVVLESLCGGDGCGRCSDALMVN